MDPIVANGGTIAPGLTVANAATSEGILTADGPITLSGSTTFAIRLALGRGTASDQLAMNSGSILLNKAILQLTIGGFLTNPTQVGQDYVIINGGAGSTGIGNDVFAQGGSINVGNYAFNILYATNPNGIGSGSDVVLQVTAVPEPGTWAAILSGFGMLLVVQRMRRARRRMSVTKREAFA